MDNETTITIIMEWETVIRLFGIDFFFFFLITNIMRLVQFSIDWGPTSDWILTSSNEKSIIFSKFTAGNYFYFYFFFFFWQTNFNIAISEDFEKKKRKKASAISDYFFFFLFSTAFLKFRYERILLFGTSCRRVKSIFYSLMFQMLFACLGLWNVNFIIIIFLT